MSTAVIWSKSKPDVEFQQGRCMGEFHGMSSQSHLPHCRVLPLANSTACHPEPCITLQGAATLWIQCHDSRAICHIARCSNLTKSMSWSSFQQTRQTDTLTYLLTDCLFIQPHLSNSTVKTRQAAQPKGVNINNDASARPPNLPWPRMTFELWPLTPKLHRLPVATWHSFKNYHALSCNALHKSSGRRSKKVSK